MHVHAGTIVADDGFGHEGDGLAVRMRDVLDHVLEREQFVALVHQRAELGADLALAGRGDFVVMHLDGQADLLKDLAHLAAQVAERIHRRDREIAALHARAMAGIAAFELAVGTPCRFLGFDLERSAAHVVAPAHRVEDEEFRFRAEKRGIGDAGRLQVSLGAPRDRTRAARIGLHGRRFEHVADEVQGRMRGEGIERRAGRIRHQHHVRIVDPLPAGDGRPVEHLAVLERTGVDGVRGKGDVMLLAEHVGKTQVDEFDVVFLDQIENGVGGHGWLRSGKGTPLFSKPDANGMNLSNSMN